MTYAYPQTADVLAGRVRELALQLGAWPSKRQVMRVCRVSAGRGGAALAALRESGFDPATAAAWSAVPTQAQPGRSQTQAERSQIQAGRSQAQAGALDVLFRDATTGATMTATALDIDTALDTGALAGPVTNAAERTHRVPRLALIIIALGAFVSIWSGWVGLGKLTGYGPVVLLPGIADGWTINSAITLPLGVEAYAAFAMWAWLSNGPVSARARRFGRISALAALGLGAAGQITYHLMVAADVVTAPWPITAFVACLPVIVLGCGAALAHLIHQT